MLGIGLPVLNGLTHQLFVLIQKGNVCVNHILLARCFRGHTLWASAQDRPSQGYTSCASPDKHSPLYPCSHKTSCFCYVSLLGPWVRNPLVWFSSSLHTGPETTPCCFSKVPVSFIPPSNDYGTYSLPATLLQGMCFPRRGQMPHVVLRGWWERGDVQLISSGMSWSDAVPGCFSAGRGLFFKSEAKRVLVACSRSLAESVVRSREKLWIFLPSSPVLYPLPRGGGCSSLRSFERSPDTSQKTENMPKRSKSMLLM